MKKLTERQAECLRGVVRYMNIKGYSPTVAEVAEMLCVYINAATHHLKRLECKGYITIAGTGRRRGAVSRCIVPLFDDRGYPLKRVPNLAVVA